MTVEEETARGQSVVLDNHRVIRDGSVWMCRRCHQTWDFPSPVPRDAGPCIERRWGDQ